MSLRERIESEGRRRGGVCTFERLRDVLSPAQLAELDEALADRNFGHRQLARALSKEYPELLPEGVASTTVGRHRNGDCSCR